MGGEQYSVPRSNLQQGKAEQEGRWAAWGAPAACHTGSLQRQVWLVLLSAHPLAAAPLACLPPCSLPCPQLLLLCHTHLPVSPL